MKDYFNTETSPRVFEHGTVSIVANQDGAGLHIGVHEIEQVLSLELSLGEKPTLEVIFKKLDIERYIRRKSQEIIINPIGSVKRIL